MKLFLIGGMEDLNFNYCYKITYESGETYDRRRNELPVVNITVWREPPVRINGATPFCLLSYFAIAGSSPYTSLIERSLAGSTLSISIL